MGRKPPIDNGHDGWNLACDSSSTYSVLLRRSSSLYIQPYGWVRCISAQDGRSIMINWFEALPAYTSEDIDSDDKILTEARKLSNEQLHSLVPISDQHISLVLHHLSILHSLMEKTADDVASAPSYFETQAISGALDHELARAGVLTETMYENILSEEQLRPKTSLSSQSFVSRFQFFITATVTELLLPAILNICTSFV